MKTVVGFLSRAHGFNVLLELVKSTNYSVLKVYTHSLKPKSEDPNRSQRENYSGFVEICKNNKIPLEKIDSKNEKIENVPQCDYIIEVSWRYLISENITNQAKITAFGIHRGKLPDYAGVQPIKQALLNQEKEIVLSAHYLASEIDSGGTIVSLNHPVNYENNCNLEENIQRLRDEITPLFSKLAFQTMDILEKKIENQDKV